MPGRSESEGVQILAARSAQEIAAAHLLFEEYAATLPIDLSFQSFAEELRSLPGRYAPPSGELLLARGRDDWLGCVALRDLGGGVSEMKRLYVRPEFQGLGIGRKLAESIVQEASGRAYEAVRLDTAPWMDSAIGLYEALGFREIEPYYHNPLPGARFYELRLRP